MTTETSTSPVTSLAIQLHSERRLFEVGILVKVSSVEQAEPVPNAEFSGERRRRILWSNDNVLQCRHRPTQRVPIVPTRNSEQVSAGQLPRAIEQPERDATPETPATE